MDGFNIMLTVILKLNYSPTPPERMSLSERFGISSLFGGQAELPDRKPLAQASKEIREHIDFVTRRVEKRKSMVCRPCDLKADNPMKPKPQSRKSYCSCGKCPQSPKPFRIRPSLPNLQAASQSSGCEETQKRIKDRLDNLLGPGSSRSKI